MFSSIVVGREKVLLEQIKTNNNFINKKKKTSSKKSILKMSFFLGIFILCVFLTQISFQLAFNTQQPIGVVMSDSMEPNINKGDILLIKGMDPEQIKVGTIVDNSGDVIVFKAQGLWADAPAFSMAHRVIDKWQDGGIWYFQTKGDANSVIDRTPIPEYRIIGVVQSQIPYIGLIFVFFIESGLVVIIIIVLAFILLSSKKKKRHFTWRDFR